MFLPFSLRHAIGRATGMGTFENAPSPILSHPKLNLGSVLLLPLTRQPFLCHAHDMPPFSHLQSRHSNTNHIIESRNSLLSAIYVNQVMMLYTLNLLKS